MTESQAPARSPVHEFDYIADPGVLADCHARYWDLKETAPPVFWTSAHGGHWVCNTGASVQHVVRHPEIFSSRYLSIPPNPNQPKMIPEMLDPPEHRPYRQMLRPFFESKAIEPLEPRVSAWTDQLLDEVVSKGECDFVEAIGSRLPVAVFMELFGFPMEKFEEFRGLVTGFFHSQASNEVRNNLAQAIVGHLAELIQQRMAEPRDDMISKIVASEVDGRKVNFEELMSIGFLMFLAGLDTVTNAMSFGMRHLAHDEKLRQRAIDDPAVIPDMVEELLRRYAFVATPRYIVEDTVLEGAQLRAGDCILAPLPLVGWDEGLTEDPKTVSVERQFYRHAAFGSGIHTCLGLHLARMELIVFYRAWFARVGHFRQVAKGDETCRGGSVMALEHLHLAWG
ncbi:cytochrome P450 [Sphingopyxis sp. OPL5]|uniref:cytochrome P450 n=1 Tax=Sphingopyxis sp. OPL5 TaxID=2486273 RepID=UPI00164DAEED|nr:cytochrome P450 [Sphingopyxis sp. OPL5]QNO27004.1 cytochrome P450 [Sphingopyxis sp. OPL5]